MTSIIGSQQLLFQELKYYEKMQHLLLRAGIPMLPKTLSAFPIKLSPQRPTINLNRPSSAKRWQIYSLAKPKASALLFSSSATCICSWALISPQWRNQRRITLFGSWTLVLSHSRWPMPLVYFMSTHTYWEPILFQALWAALRTQGICKVTIFALKVITILEVDKD